MRLSTLNISGFKSFAKKTELQFGSGITAVIGPNGSGKSNIADAVRWVLGEQSAKALRGTKMEDVIFGGTQTRRPQSGCEVTLTFDNRDHALPMDFDDVAITRRVFRSGESEYAVNGRTCRLKDVLDLFRDTGIGKDGYSIISQGRVDEILSNRSNERRAALEEAAGVMRYRVRKEEAERKLDQTQKNMERIYDVLGELEARIEPLRAQSETARQFLKLRDELKDLDINMYLYQTDRARERMDSLREAVAEMERELAVNAASDQDMAASCAELELQVQQHDAELAVLQNKLLSMLSGVETHVGECKLLIERRDNAKKERARLEDEIQDASEQIRHLTEAAQLLDQDTPDACRLTALEEHIRALSAAVDAMDEQVLEQAEAIDAMKNAIMEELNRLSDARSDRSRLDAMEAALHDRLSALDAADSRGEEQTEALTCEMAAAAQMLSELEDKRGKAQRELANAQKNRAACEQAFLTMQQEQRELDQNAAAIESRLHVVREMVRSREGYQNSVRQLMKDAASDPQLSSCITGVVAELIDVPKEYEQAIGMSLGGSLQNIVTPNARDAKRVIEYLRTHEIGRATMLPVSLLTPNPLTERERRFLDADGCIGLASELVGCKDGMQRVVDYLLGRTVVVRDLDSGIALKERSGGAFHITTLLGDFISTGGTMTGGSTSKRSFGLLGRERELKELEDKLKDASVARARKQTEAEDAKHQILLADMQIDAFGTAVHDADVALAREKEKADMILRDRETAAEQAESRREQRTEIRDALMDIAARKAQSETLQQDIERNNTVSREDVIRAQQALSAARQEREKKAQELTELRISEMALRKEAHARAQERERLSGEIVARQRSITAWQSELSSLDQRQAEADKRLAEMETGVAGEQADAEAVRQEQERLEKRKHQLSEQLMQHRQTRDTLNEAYRQTGDRKHKAELALGKAELETAALQDRIWQDYELTYDNAQAFRHAFPVGATGARIAELRQQIRALGDINVSSIEDYELVSERYEGLTTQYADLEQAKTDLYTIIGQLTDTMQGVFTSEFQKVQVNFTEVFSELFGGGVAELRLADPKDVLNCDIDIIAQPPGKKLQLLSLLSGGERALTAIALLFAMLRLKAPAFCVLDEIETSLDEANVSRFAEYLRRYSETTQFIIITHRKGSMEVCDTLYGVAMEEKGVSTIVSARFGEAS